jgi:hypothetical protein
MRISLGSTAWSTVEFPVASYPDTEGVLIRASSSGSPVLLDQLIIRPTGGTPYTAWAAATGLDAHPLAGPDLDADQDGLLNLIEFAFGLDPLRPHTSTTAITLPVVRLAPRPGLPPAIIVQFFAVPGVRYDVETASPDTPDHWTRVHTLSTSSAGRRAWQSPDTTPATTQLLVRVRVSPL